MENRCVHDRSHCLRCSTASGTISGLLMVAYTALVIVIIFGLGIILTMMHRTAVWLGLSIWLSFALLIGVVVLTYLIHSLVHFCRLDDVNEGAAHDGNC